MTAANKRMRCARVGRAVTNSAVANPNTTARAVAADEAIRLLRSRALNQASIARRWHGAYRWRNPNRSRVRSSLPSPRPAALANLPVRLLRSNAEWFRAAAGTRVVHPPLPDCADRESAQL